MYYRNRMLHRKFQSPAAAPTVEADAAPNGDPIKIEALRETLRDLWTDYAWRNRDYLVTMLHPHEDRAVSRSLVLQNIDEMRLKIFNVYYSNAGGLKFRDLMTDCFDSMTSVINYAINSPNDVYLGKDAFLERLKDSWKDKSSALFEFFAEINPKIWRNDEMKKIINDLQNLWTNQIISRDRSEWALDLSYVDQVFRVSSKMAKILADGVIDQNPGKLI